MSELSCDTPFIGQNETHDLSRYFLRLLSWSLLCAVYKMKRGLINRPECGGGYLSKFTPPQRGSIPPLSDGFTPPIKQRAARIS